MAVSEERDEDEARGNVEARTSWWRRHHVYQTRRARCEVSTVLLLYLQQISRALQG